MAQELSSESSTNVNYTSSIMSDNRGEFEMLYEAGYFKYNSLILLIHLVILFLKVVPELTW